MSYPAAAAQRRFSQKLVICCVLLAVSIFGLSSTLVSLLGSQHAHTQPARNDAATLVLEDFRRVAHHGGVRSAPSHDHLQSVWQRHRHDNSDSSVQSLDARASGESLARDASASAFAAIVLMASAADGLAVPFQSDSVAWSMSEEPLLGGCDPDPLERPPKS